MSIVEDSDHGKSLIGSFLTHKKWKSLLFAVLLAGVVFLLYANTFNSPFMLDDWSNITSTYSIRLADLSLESLKQAARDSHISTRPVASITFALNFFFHKFRLPGYHFVNILIHAVAGIFLYFFFMATLTLESQRQGLVFSKLVPFAAALLWVVHPLHVQSVTYIVQRMNSLASMFYILAMLLYVRGRISSVMLEKFIYFAGCLVSGLLALGSKEVTATLPFFILLYEWYFLQDLRLSWLKKRVLPIAAVIILSGVTVLFYLGADPVTWIQNSYGSRDFTMDQRILTELRVVLFYISQVFLPHPSRLNLEHHFVLSNSMVDPVATLFSLGLILAIFTVAIILAKRQRLVSFCILWFLGNLVIESSFIGLEIVFEHRTYLPSMLFILAVVVLADRFLKYSKLKTAVMVLVLLVFSTWTYQRNIVWQDELALTRDSVVKSPEKPRANMVYGRALERVKKYDEAVLYYSKAIELNPAIGTDMVHYNLGNVLVMQEKYGEAVFHYQEAMVMNPHIDMIRINLANALELQGKSEEAIVILEELLRLNPENDSAHHNLGVIMLKLGRLASAEYHFSEALRLGFSLAALNLEKVKKERARRAKESYMFLRRPGSQGRRSGQ